MTAPLLPAGARERLIRLAGLLGSEFVGERSNAAALATRLLRDHGLTWRELLTPTSLTSSTSHGSAPSPWRVDVDLCLRHLGWLRVWERGFVSSVAAQQALSTKQRTILSDIAAGLRARGAK